MKCPIEGCKRESKKIESLKHHLYLQHNKTELIEALSSLIGEVEHLKEKIRIASWSKKRRAST